MAVLTKVVQIDPELAASWLALNTNNRPVRERVVRRYAEDMAKGRWKLNGESIKLNGTRLLDGQHRLMAIVQSNVSVPMYVIEGLDSDVFETIDTGMKRTASDALSITGATNQTQVASAITFYYLIVNDLVKVPRYPTNSEIVDIYKDHPGIADAVRAASRVSTLIPISVFAALYYIFTMKDPDIAESFLNKLQTGDNLSPDSPILHLRNRMVTKKKNPSHRTERFLIAGYVIKSWNAYRQNKPMQRLTMSFEEDLPSIL